MKSDYSRYIISLIITIAIFATSFYVSNYFTNKKLDNVKNIQDNIAVDLLSNETQFLLKEISCSDESMNAVAPQINELGDKLTYTEGQLGADNATVIYLKKYYSLLEIKDYLLGKRVADKCGDKNRPIFMIYMYSNKFPCDDCQKQASVLSRLREIYPELKVYTFDYDLDLTPIETLKKIYKIEANFPVLVIEDKTYYGLKDVDQLKLLLPDTLKESIATSTATTTSSSTNVKSSTSILKLKSTNTNR